MCEANVFVIDTEPSEANPGELFLEAVDEIVPEGENLWRLTSIFGEQKTIIGRIHSMHLVDHRILFQRAAT
ncbi:MAG: CooT family nickel-binding protein [Deltaproteobacteria bacterium]|jgi:predicted RNA-binding protein|nr:CooT family nickel-binding protein [Deltaproteobacteria bacterium]